MKATSKDLALASLLSPYFDPDTIPVVYTVENQCDAYAHGGKDTF